MIHGNTKQKQHLETHQFWKKLGIGAFDFCLFFPPPRSCFLLPSHDKQVVYSSTCL